MNGNGIGALEWITGGGFMALVVFSIGTYVKVSKIKEQITTEITNSDKETNGKMARVYQRLDEVKDKNDEDYARKDLCREIHSQVNATLNSIIAKVDCIPSMKIQLDLFVQKFEK